MDNEHARSEHPLRSDRRLDQWCASCHALRCRRTTEHSPVDRSWWLLTSPPASWGTIPSRCQAPLVSALSPASLEPLHLHLHCRFPPDPATSSLRLAISTDLHEALSRYPFHPEHHSNLESPRYEDRGRKNRGTRPRLVHNPIG